MNALDAPTQQHAAPAPTVGPAPAGDTSYVGRHRARCGHAAQPTVADPVAPGHSPLAPAVRQALAPGWWATRHLPAGPDDRTGLYRLDDIQHARDTDTTETEVTR